MRDPSHVPHLLKMMKGMHIVVVLVYADWCPHCHTYKDEIWKHLISASKRKVGLASIQAEQLKHTPLANAKLKGYPSVLLIGKDGKPAEFEGEDGNPTNALPNARNREMMEKMVTSDPGKVLPDGALGPTGRLNKPPMDDMALDNTKELMNESKESKVSPEEVTEAAADLSRKSPLPPNPSTDIDRELSRQRVVAPVGGGALYQSLLKAAVMTAPAVGLATLGAATLKRRSRLRLRKGAKTRKHSRH